MLYLLYDEECWICRNAMLYAQVASRVDIKTIPARSSDSSWLSYVRDQGYNMDKGSILIDTYVSPVRIYQGKQVVSALQPYIYEKSSSLYGRTKNGVYTMLSICAKHMYPLLVVGRKFLLWCKGISTHIDNKK